MRILSVHNRYIYEGGEDSARTAEIELLRAHGHEVLEYNDDNRRTSGSNSLAIAGRLLWSQQAYREISSVLRSSPCDIAHFHNTFVRISPSAYYAVKGSGAAVVQTLHNYRLICPAATLYRDGGVCEECVGTRFMLPAIIHKCYHESALQSAGVAGMMSFHNFLGTWEKHIDIFIVASEFSRTRFVKGGLPDSKIIVKSNFSTEAFSPRDTTDQVFYSGRLSEEKGLHDLVDAWEGFTERLCIAGDGPIREELENRARRSGAHIEFKGHLGRDKLVDELSRSRFVVAPSRCYENSPMSVIEAFSWGKAVVASRIGALEEMVEDGRTGILFPPGDVKELSSRLTWALSHPGDMARMGENAKKRYEEKYTPSKNYAMLMDIYKAAIDRRGRSVQPGN